MARTDQDPVELATLIQRLENSRGALGTQLGSLRHKIDIPRRFKRSIAGQPWRWFGGAFGSGLLASLALRARRCARRGGKFARLISFLAGSAMRPALKAVLVPFLLQQAKRRFLHDEDDHDRTRPRRSAYPLSKY